ncbi:MAG: MmgE/PrpD family protein [Betaproteobacteria bacterium]|nr:MmgE/PrpD family protein [Betaproteobacteria bacterium]MBI3057405.1 MmgE/PrpD family protein [Betaproteobacteria bacterium]
MMLIDGTVTFKSAHDFRRMRDPKVRNLRSKVQAVGDPALTDVERRWCCVMEIRLKDGRVLHGQTIAAKGSYENPLTRAEEEEKALGLLTPVLGKTRSQALLKALWNFEQLEDVRALRKLYST